MSRYVRADQVNFMTVEDLTEPKREWAKIRYNHRGAWCTVEKTGEDEILCTFEDVVRAAAKLLRPGGRFYLVHRPFRLAELITVLSAYHLEPKRMRLVYPYVDREPNMVLIEAVRGGRPRMTVEKPLIVYERPGVYTNEITDIYGY